MGDRLSKDSFFGKNTHLLYKEKEKKAFLHLVLLQWKFLNKIKFYQGNNTFFLFSVVKKAYFIHSTPKNNVEMKTILWSYKSSQPLQSVP